MIGSVLASPPSSGIQNPGLRRPFTSAGSQKRLTRHRWRFSFFGSLNHPDANGVVINDGHGNRRGVPGMIDRPQIIPDARQLTRLALVAACCLAAIGRAHACNHAAPVSFAQPDMIPTKSPAQRSSLPSTNLAAPHNPIDPLGPCQTPHCNGRQERSDQPLTNAVSSQARDNWSLPASALVVEQPSRSATIAIFARHSAQAHHAAIFHPPR